MWEAVLTSWLAEEMDPCRHHKTSGRRQRQISRRNIDAFSVQYAVFVRHVLQWTQVHATEWRERNYPKRAGEPRFITHAKPNGA